MDKLSQILKGTNNRPEDILRSIWRYRALYFMLVPGVIYYITFRYGPMYGAVIAFKDYSVMDGIWKSPWANPWYKHFEYFFRSPYFLQLMTNTFLISLYKMFAAIPLSIFMAVALSEVGNIRFRRVIQTITYLPHFLSWVIIYGILFAFMSETHGLINMILKQRGFNSINFLSSLSWFRSILVGSEVWKDTGWGAIIYIAAIMGIDTTLYEAAKMDGAKRIQIIWHVTLPCIRNVIIVLLLLRLGNILDAGFEQIYVMYNIHVYPVADIIDTWVFRTGLQQWNFSLASAVGLFKSFIGITLIVTVNRLARSWGESLW